MRMTLGGNILAVALVLAVAPMALMAAQSSGPVLDNAYRSANLQEAALGRMLFWGPILSGTRNIAYVTCLNRRFGSPDGVSLGLGQGGIGLGRELTPSIGTLNDAQMEPETRQIEARLNPDFAKFNAPVSALSGGQHQPVAIARAAHFNARIPTMDQPTAASGLPETQMVAKLISELKKQGIGIFLIEHDIHDGMNPCDHASVMKNGPLVGTVNVNDVTGDGILGKMPGSET